VGQELSRCTGFCLGLRSQTRRVTERKGTKMAGIKYGVWQLHILLIDGIRGIGVWTFLVD
jgi:hypothetical protein